MTAKEKLVEVLAWIGGVLSLLCLLVMCAAGEYGLGSRKHKIFAPGIEDMCASIENEPCGAKITQCESGAEYRCVTNLIIQSR